MANDLKGVRGGAGVSRPDLTTVPVNAASRAAAPYAGVNAVTDRLSLTDIAAQIQSLVRALDRAPVVDLARVSSVRESLANGTYQIDPFRIADKLIAFERMLPDLAYGEPRFA